MRRRHWYGFVVRSDTPADVVNTISQGSNKAIDDSRVKAGMEGLGIKMLGGAPDQFSRHIRAEMDRGGAVLRKAGIKLRGRPIVWNASRCHGGSRRLLKFDLIAMA